ncbi:hypothetical protein NicSoilB4_34680 [Arthrobacter sp. NicSoilB4]|uniref:hypothetical protein n=1 Tax=Arthrobacter sp. NicSoilB4 TaxID=2830997 RepID=UPI001CC6FF09|nr:hypothetical protein [Arthrobacter sp. NicSoilB4]BCW68705.1 hypothetical protein NicSoilB4_34680 [Arthrobacter sp. NicSoilB4]
MTHRHHGTRSSAYYAHPSHGDPKIKVLIRIDALAESARVDVRGVVTPANIRALYVVCRRVAAKLPGYEIVVDLAHARVTADAIEELHEHARQSVVSSGIDASVTPCRLRIVDPPTILRIKENA